MKKIIFLLFSFCLTFLILGKQAEAATSPSIYIDGEKVMVSTATVNGNTLVPLRAIAEKLGLNVGWDSKSQFIIVSHPHRLWELHHKVGTSYSQRYIRGNLNGGARYMNTSSMVRDGVTYVPIRFFENMDAQVNWDANKNRIDVYSYELKMNQYLILTTLAYNDLGNYANNQTTLDKVFPKISGDFKSTFDNVKNKLYIYTNYTYSDFASNEMLMKDWVVKTTLTKSDFPDSSEYKKFNNSGFVGYAFRNIRTNEVVISYRGTNFTSLNDWNANRSSLTKKGNAQKPYALQLFRKSISGASYVTVVGHSLGGNLAQGVAAYYPSNYNKMVTFNAYGSNIKIKDSSEYEKAINYTISTDPVKAIRTHYGQVIKYKIRAYPDTSNISAHSLFNFYSYYFKPNSKYWNSGYGVPFS